MRIFKPAAGLQLKGAARRLSWVFVLLLVGVQATCDRGQSFTAPMTVNGLLTASPSIGAAPLAVDLVVQVLDAPPGSIRYAFDC